MGVIVAKRTESTAQFITTANELLVYSTKTATKLPKKYTFYGAHHAYELAQAIVDDLIRANSLFFTAEKPQNFQPRQALFDKALGNLNCLSTHIVYLQGLSKETEQHYWLKWGSLINSTRELVRKVKDSDLNRIKKS